MDDDVNREKGHAGTQLTGNKGPAQPEPILLDAVCLIRAIKCQVRLNHVKTPSYDAAWAEQVTTSYPEDLSKDEMVELAEHVATCSACSAALAQYQKIDELLGNLCLEDKGAHEAVFGLPEALLQAWKREDEKASKPRRVLRLTRAISSSLSTHRQLLRRLVTFSMMLFPPVILACVQTLLSKEREKLRKEGIAEEQTAVHD
jgi:hypothetical protein